MEVRQSRELASRLADVEDHLAGVEEAVAETFDRLAASPRGREDHAKVAAEARVQAETARRAARERRRLGNDEAGTARLRRESGRRRVESPTFPW